MLGLESDSLGGDLHPNCSTVVAQLRWQQFIINLVSKNFWNNILCVRLLFVQYLYLYCTSMLTYSLIYVYFNYYTDVNTGTRTLHTVMYCN